MEEQLSSSENFNYGYFCLFDFLNIITIKNKGYSILEFGVQFYPMIHFSTEFRYSNYNDKSLDIAFFLENENDKTLKIKHFVVKFWKL